MALDCVVYDNQIWVHSYPVTKITKDKTYIICTAPLLGIDYSALCPSIVTYIPDTRYKTQLRPGWRMLPLPGAGRCGVTQPPRCGAAVVLAAVYSSVWR